MTGVRWTEDQLADYERRRMQPGRIGLDADSVRGDTKLRPATGQHPAGGSFTPGGEGVENSPRPSKRGHPEDDLQMAVADFLDVALPRDHRWMHIPNGGMRDEREAARLKGMGLKPGAADVLILRPPPQSFVWIELKSPVGSLSKEQKDWRNWCQSVGAPWFLCRSLDAVIAACAHAGIPLRVRAA